MYGGKERAAQAAGHSVDDISALSQSKLTPSIRKSAATGSKGTQQPNKLKPFPELSLAVLFTK